MIFTRNGVGAGSRDRISGNGCGAPAFWLAADGYGFGAPYGDGRHHGVGVHGKQNSILVVIPSEHRRFGSPILAMCFVLHGWRSFKR